MRGKAVAQCVAADLLVDARLAGRRLDRFLKTADMHMVPPFNP